MAAALSLVAAAAVLTLPCCQEVRKVVAVLVTSVADSGPVLTFGLWSSADADVFCVRSSAAAPAP